MSAFVDTAALYALLVRNEAGHAAVMAAFDHLLSAQRPLVTSNYILLETTALLQRRIGLDAVRDLVAYVVPLLTCRWIGQVEHRRALDRLVRADRHQLSLVDCSSFDLMEREGITTALTLDRHFRQEGFDVVPA